MASCCHCGGIERQFGAKKAGEELGRFRRQGPIPTTRMLLAALPSDAVIGASVLDVGGGVGAISHELLASGAREAVQVDISADYIEAAREEAERRGHADRLRFVRGDFVALASELEPSDIVTLDRVICCYPDVERLVARSAGKARLLYGAVYPRREWWTRPVFAVMNLMYWIRGTSFRVYLHHPEKIDALVEQQGLTRRSARDTLVWRVTVYARSA